jgi:hypothetical protein
LEVLLFSRQNLEKVVGFVSATEKGQRISKNKKKINIKIASRFFMLISYNLELYKGY